MNLDGALEGRFPGIQLIVARDASGKVQGSTGTRRPAAAATSPSTCRGAGAGAQRHRRTAQRRHDHGRENNGAQRLSLAFAAFPEIFDEKNRSRAQRVFYRLIHVLDPLIALESLYRYVRKFHALDARRYALISLTQIVTLLIVLLSLEFMPRRRHL